MPSSKLQFVAPFLVSGLVGAGSALAGGAYWVRGVEEDIEANAKAQVSEAASRERVEAELRERLARYDAADEKAERRVQDLAEAIQAIQTSIAKQERDLEWLTRYLKRRD